MRRRARAILSNVWRVVRVVAQRVRAAGARALEVVGDYGVELAGVVVLLSLLGYARFGPQNVLLLRVGSTAISAPSWVVALLVLLIFAVVFWLVVSQLED